MTPARPLLARLPWYWICQVVGWSVPMLLALAIGPSRAQVGPEAWARYAGVCCWGIAWGIVVSDLWRRLLKRKGWAGGRDGLVRIMCGVLVLGMLSTAIQLLGYIFIRPFGPVRGLAWLPGALLTWWIDHLVWNVFYMAALSVRRANRLEAEALRLEISVKDAELLALQAQVNPHFFFNSMNSVRALVYEDRDAAGSMIDELTSVMRYALQAGRQDTVPLADEIGVVRAYLAIESIRFEERLRVDIAIGADLDTVRVPPMSVQTLVENAVKYGVEARPGGSEIRITAHRLIDGAVQIDVANEGDMRAFATSTGIGIANARQRLALVLGVGACLDLHEHGGWVRATMRLPGRA